MAKFSGLIATSFCFAGSAFVLAFVWTLPAAAQTAAPKPVPDASPATPAEREQQRTQTEHSDPKACAPRGTSPNAELGDKLAKTDGVICPPSGVDPDIRAPTPQTGTMPVIPPPGSPGGDPSVRPK